MAENCISAMNGTLISEAVLSAILSTVPSMSDTFVSCEYNWGGPNDSSSLYTTAPAESIFSIYGNYTLWIRAFTVRFAGVSATLSYSGSSVSPAPSITPYKPTSKIHSTKISIEVGVSIGGLALLLAIAAVYFLLRRRRLPDQPDEPEDAAGEAELPSESIPPNLSANEKMGEPVYDFWTHITSKHLDSIYLAVILFDTPLYAHKHLQTLTHVANLTHLHIQDCDNVDEFLTDLGTLLQNLKCFVLRMDSRTYFDDDIVDFIMQQHGLGELGLQFSTRGRGANDVARLPRNHAQTLRKLVILREPSDFELEQYLTSIITSCPHLTHLGLLFHDLSNSYYDGVYHEFWESDVRKLAAVLKTASHFTHVNINILERHNSACLPVLVPGKDKYRYRITA
ncbi:hypothetical protein K458DRAFT_381258 [Lentithecium fluviatile CBS 122367]|uniref:Uncharacterized protein n=1 Tax=Lentithecium fluviatile CBS 122367 TaxID=1168545 RepID=A0A6G1JLT9_9PLEO|nr:hypothetical protein K458DRAFT_381258 [Lentithecium fluviatile CBS 122367]